MAEIKPKQSYPPAEPPWMPQEKISETVGLSQNRVSVIIENANFGNIDNLLTQGHDMEYTARHYHLDLAPAPPQPPATT